MWCLKSSRSTRPQVHIGTRDRAMLLISATTAYRGDNTRRLLLSDITIRDVPMVDIGLDAKAMVSTLFVSFISCSMLIFRVQALILVSDQGKTNTNGRLDEQATFRHRKPELCAIGGLGFYLFSLYHLLETEHPSFVPDYSDDRGGEFGYRGWYRMFLFPGSGGACSEMTYESKNFISIWSNLTNYYTYIGHRKRVNLMHIRNKILIKKVTHAGRPFAAMAARQHRATADDTKALGNWSQGGSFRDCYDRSLPVDAMLAAASFNAKKQDSYFIPRDVLSKPNYVF